MRYNGGAGSETLGNISTSIIQEISGKIGYNYTGLDIGSFAETSGSYVTAYAYNGESGDQSVYLAYTDKHNLIPALPGFLPRVPYQPCALSGPKSRAAIFSGIPNRVGRFFLLHPLFCRRQYR